MELLKFITPFYYTYRYNRTGLEGIAFFLEYTILPFVAYFIYPSSMSLHELIVIVIIVTTTYEIGYIYNNIVSIRAEDNPTLRHDQQEIFYANKHLYDFFGIRFILIVLLILYLYIWDSSYLLYTAGGVIAILIVFYLYNTLRTGWINRFLFFLLRFSRYFFTLLFIGFSGFVISLLISLVSLVNSLSWYPTRTKMSFPRFFGTKLFDGLIYAAFAWGMYIYDKKYLACIFIYLSLVKFILFGYKLLPFSYR